MPPVLIRTFKLEDKSFIIASWLKGQLFGNEWFKAMDQVAYYQHYPAYINRILSDNDIEVKIACLAEDEDVILGYAVSKGSTLFWCFVKAPWRLQGIARKLVDIDKIKVCTGLTKPGHAIMKKKSIKFNPFAI